MTLTFAPAPRDTLSQPTLGQAQTSGSTGVAAGSKTGLTVGGTKLVVAGLTKRYKSVLALDDVTLTVEPGCFQALLGPSGSGKTSLLMSVAGFLQPDRGSITVNGESITPLPPERRNFGMVFQGYALFPHLTAQENVAFPLRARRVPVAEKMRRAAAAIELVRLAPYAHRLPRELSGGQQQRVAIARAIVFEPDLLLLDEPLSALDRALRSDLQIELRSLQRKLGLTCLYVTHDQDEALSMADRVAVLAGGRIVQNGAPVELYERPNSQFVASFLGKSNFLEGTAEGREGDLTVVRCGDHVLRHAGAIKAGGVLLALRPEKIAVGALEAQSPGFNRLTARLRTSIYLGNAWEISAEVDGIGALLIRASSATGANLSPGQELAISWPADATVEVRPNDTQRSA